MALVGSAMYCPVCGASGQQCGQSVAGPPVDENVIHRKGSQMGELREYDVVLNGQPTTAMLTEEQAKRMKATPVGEKADDDADDTAATKARTTVRNKRRDIE